MHRFATQRRLAWSAYAAACLLQGICRLPGSGFVVFVDRALPGERLTARVLQVKKSFAKALKLHTLEPHEAPAEPACQVRFGMWCAFTPPKPRPPFPNAQTPPPLQRAYLPIHCLNDITYNQLLIFTVMACRPCARSTLAPAAAAACRICNTERS